MLIPTAIATEVARYRHLDFVARADRYRLSRCVNHASTASGWPGFRRVLLRWLHLGHMSLDASEDGAIVGDRVPHGSHARAAAR